MRIPSNYCSKVDLVAHFKWGFCVVLSFILFKKCRYMRILFIIFRASDMPYLIVKRRYIYISYATFHKQFFNKHHITQLTSSACNKRTIEKKRFKKGVCVPDSTLECESPINEPAPRWRDDCNPGVHRAIFSTVIRIMRAFGRLRLFDDRIICEGCLRNRNEGSLPRIYIYTHTHRHPLMQSLRLHIYISNGLYICSDASNNRQA